MVKDKRSTVDGRRSRGTASWTVILALLVLVWGVFVPAARGASTDQTQEQLTPTEEGSTTTTQPAPSTSTTYVTIIMSIPMTVTTTVDFPFPEPAEDSFPPSTMAREPEPFFDRDEDVGSEPAPWDRDTLPADGADPAGLSAADANRPGPSTTLRAQPSTRQSTPSKRVSEPPVDMTADRSPSLFWPGVFAVGCLLLLSGPAAARKLRHARRQDEGHDVRHDVA